jgi:hypothetical protein
MSGGLAQLAERVLSMHEVAGSIPAFSNPSFLAFAFVGQFARALVSCWLVLNSSTVKYRQSTRMPRHVQLITM